MQIKVKTLTGTAPHLSSGLQHAAVYKCPSVVGWMRAARCTPGGRALMLSEYSGQLVLGLRKKQAKRRVNKKARLE